MDCNIVCIDPSLSCSAVVVNDKKAAFTTEEVAHTKALKLKKWFEICEPYVEFHFHSFNKKKLSYTMSELSKLNSYNGITDTILEFIKRNLDVSRPTKVFMEGYSFSSAAGPLIDLVTFGTLLRKKIINDISPDLTVIAPTELKLYAAKLTYAPIIEKKREVYRNSEGISGGSFKKHHMYQALIENKSLSCEWIELLREHASDILEQTNIPKPIEDINDAKLMFEIAIQNKYL